MDKEYFTSINVVSQELGVPAHTLRYWEKQFPTVVRPTTGAGGRRYYRAETITRLRTIQDLLYNRGMTIAGVKKLIKSGEFTSIDVENKAVVQPIASVEPVTGPASMDLTKIELAVGLLNQAKELLKQ